MACEGSYNKIPINVSKSDTNQLSKNLSRFTYDLKNISKINIVKTNKGSFFIKIPQKGVAHMPTLGKLDLVNVVFFMKSVNEYNGKKVDMEIILVFINKNNKPLLIFIPIEKVDSSSKSSKFFGQFAGFTTNKKEQEISVNNFNFNDIIPQDSFISYKSRAPYLAGCNYTSNMIFFEKTLNIKESDYETLIKNYGEINISEFSPTNTNNEKNSKNYEIKKINQVNASLDYTGTKNGPGLRSSNETLPLICTPVEDEKGDSISGKSRLDWVKGSFESVSPGVKNMFYLILIVGILIGAMVFLHSFIFKSLGKLLGDDSIVTRSSSLI
jgi:carbonic anhydrase